MSARRATVPAAHWFGVLGAPLAWTGQLVVGYGLEEVACGTGTATNDYWGVSPTTLIALVTVAAGAVAVAAGLVSLATFRSARREPAADPSGRVGYMAAVGALASALFLVAIVLGGVQLVTLHACRQG